MPPKLIALIIKELLSAFRDPRTRVAFIIPPIMQVFLYAYAATLEVTQRAHRRLQRGLGQSSRQLVSRFEQALSLLHDHLFQEREGNPARDRQPERAGSRSHPAGFFAEGGGARAGERAGASGWAKSNSAQILNGYINSIVANFARRCRAGRGAARSQRGSGPLLVQPEPEYRKHDGAGPCGHAHHDDGADGDGDVGFARAGTRHLRAASRLAAAANGNHRSARPCRGSSSASCWGRHNRDRDAGVRHPADRLRFSCSMRA